MPSRVVWILPSNFSAHPLGDHRAAHPSGVAAATATKAKVLAELGHQVFVVTGTDADETSLDPRFDGFRVVRIPQLPWSQPADVTVDVEIPDEMTIEARHLSTLFEDLANSIGRPNIVLTEDWHRQGAAEVQAVAGIRRWVPVLNTIHTPGDSVFRRQAISSLGAVQLAVSPEVNSMIEADPPFLVRPPGIDFDVDIRPLSFVDQLDGEVFMVGTARPLFAKGTLTAVEMLSFVRRDRRFADRRIHLIIPHTNASETTSEQARREWSERKVVEARAAELDVTVHFPAFSPEETQRALASLRNRNGILLLLSQSEGWSLVAAEAVMNGVLGIYTDIAGLRHAPGLKVATTGTPDFPADPREVAGATIKLLTDAAARKDLRSRYADAARDMDATTAVRALVDTVIEPLVIEFESEIDLRDGSGVAAGNEVLLSHGEEHH